MAAAGEWVGDKVSIFRIAYCETENLDFDDFGVTERNAFAPMRSAGRASDFQCGRCSGWSQQHWKRATSARGGTDMSLDETKLRSDFESYLRGEKAPDAELATAPQLDEWDVLITKSPGDGTYQASLIGTVINHPKDDGRVIQTSPFVWLDHRSRWGHTMSRLYGDHPVRRPATSRSR